MSGHMTLKKMSACRMQRLLQAMYPNRYDMPTKQQVQAAITAMAADEKKQKKKAAGLRCATTNDNTRDREEDPNANCNGNKIAAGAMKKRRINDLVDGETGEAAEELDGQGGTGGCLVKEKGADTDAANEGNEAAPGTTNDGNKDEEGDATVDCTEREVDVTSTMAVKKVKCQ